MELLENRATVEYDAWRREWDQGRAQVAHPTTDIVLKELVALGIVTEAHEADGVVEGDTIMWYELENVAEPNADGRGEFFVDGLAIFDTLKVAADDAGYLRIGADTRRCIDAMLRERVVVLWHTHTATTDPSREDIDEFPTWLADYGMVYHVPTGTTTVYNSAGIIPTSAELESPLATSKE